MIKLIACHLICHPLNGINDIYYFINENESFLKIFKFIFICYLCPDRLQNTGVMARGEVSAM
jgi:hypothetical protein